MMVERESDAVVTIEGLPYLFLAFFLVFITVGTYVMLTRNMDDDDDQPIVLPDDDSEKKLLL